MDFSDLMNFAKSKQQVTEQKVKSKKSRDGNSSQVSSEAVKAFLARKNAEKARQKEQEEAAKRARIQARLLQAQKDKSSNNKKADTPAGAKDYENHRQSIQQKGSHYPTPTVQLSKIETKQKTEGNKRSSQETKYLGNKKKEIRMKKPDGKSVGKRNDRKDKRQPSNSQKSAAPKLSFDELMNVAKLQANNPDAIRNLAVNRQLKEKEKGEKVEKKMRTKDSQKKDETLKRKRPLAEKPSISSKISKESTEKKYISSVSKKKGKDTANIQERTFPRKAEPEVKRTLYEKPKKMVIERETISERRDHHSSVKRRDILPNSIPHDHRKRRYNDYSLGDDYEDEMDEFIDDSEAAPNISSYIKEIFGYDRNRFRDRDDDIDNMESSFAEIQREEAKSSRIAKLEDEIERLKETYELQQHKKKKKKLKH